MYQRAASAVVTWRPHVALVMMTSSGLRQQLQWCMDFGDVFSNSLYDFSHGVNNYTEADDSSQPPITLVFVSLAVSVFVSSRQCDARRRYWVDRVGDASIAYDARQARASVRAGLGDVDLRTTAVGDAWSTPWA